MLLLKFRVDVLSTLNFRDVMTAVPSATLSHSLPNMWSHADVEKGPSSSLMENVTGPFVTPNA